MLFWLLAGLGGWILISCSHTSDRMDVQSPPVVVSPSAGDDEAAVQTVSSADSPSVPKKHTRRDIENLEEELERKDLENQSLKEENDWLRVQVIQLQQALIDANQSIYSLNRKLDAIFKPN